MSVHFLKIGNSNITGEQNLVLFLPRRQFPDKHGWLTRCEHIIAVIIVHFTSTNTVSAAASYKLTNSINIS